MIREAGALGNFRHRGPMDPAQGRLDKKMLPSFRAIPDPPDHGLLHSGITQPVCHASDEHGRHYESSKFVGIRDLLLSRLPLRPSVEHSEFLERILNS